MSELPREESFDSSLLNEVKLFLRITWDDDSTNEQMNNLINEAKGYLQGDNCAGTEIDFDEDLQARRLLKEYCRYTYNYSFEYFQENFKSELWSLVLRYADKE